MKRIILAAIAFVAIAVSPAKAGNDRPIRFEQLPQAVRTFVSKHFGQKEISFITSEQEVFGRTYDVVFTDGCKAEFARDGAWEEVDCQRMAVPSSVIPPQIARHVAQQHPGMTIVKISRGRRGYEVELDNRFDIHYDRKFNVVRYDD